MKMEGSAKDPEADGMSVPSTRTVSTGTTVKRPLRSLFERMGVR